MKESTKIIQKETKRAIKMTIACGRTGTHKQTGETFDFLKGWLPRTDQLSKGASANIGYRSNSENKP